MNAEQLMELELAGETKVFWKLYLTLSACPPQVPHNLIRATVLLSVFIVVAHVARISLHTCVIKHDDDFKQPLKIKCK
jgi:hypothetical protein